MRRRVTVTGRADVATAWGRYLVPSRWPDWAPQIRAVDTTGDRLVPGLRGIVRGPIGVAVPFHVDAVDEAARTWRWTVTVAGVRVTMWHDLATTPVGTVAGLTLDGPPPIALGYGPMARVALRRLVRDRTR